MSYIEIQDVDGCLLRAGSFKNDPGVQMGIIPHSLLPDGEPASVLLEPEELADLMVYLVGRLDAEGRERVLEALTSGALAPQVAVSGSPATGVAVTR